MADSRASLVVMTDAEHRDHREGDRCRAGDYWADRPYDPVPDMDHLLWSQGYCDGPPTTTARTALSRSHTTPQRAR